MNWRWIAMTGMLAALVVGFGALTGRDPYVAVTDIPQRPPAYYLNDAVIIETQPDGSPKVRLVADRIEQHPDDDSIVLNDVRVDYLKVPNKRWVLSAEEGFVPADSRTIELSGNVELRPAEGPASTYLRTDALAIDTEKNRAYTTTSPTRMKYGNFAMRVKKLEADLATEKITLESVNGSSERS